MALRFQQQSSLQRLNTLGVPSQAEYYCELTNQAQLQDILDFARSKKLKLSVLGSGSNLILAPSIAGLVCHVRLLGVTSDVQGHKVRVRAAAGEQWHNFVRYTIGQGWSGLEALSLIPGQVGAAPIQNIGAYGTELSQWVHSVEAVGRADGKVRVFSAQECEFAYRDSIFKQSSGYVVTAVTFELVAQSAGLKEAAEQYPDVANELASLGWDQPSTRQLAEAVIRVRRRKLPNPALQGNVGSVFQNPVVSIAQALELKKLLPALVSYPGSSFGQVKLAAAQLIDAAGWKGRSAEGFSVWVRQPLVLIRDGNASAADGYAMRNLTSAIAEDVEQRYGVQLVLEPQLLGFD